MRETARQEAVQQDGKAAPVPTLPASAAEAAIRGLASEAESPLVRRPLLLHKTRVYAIKQAELHLSRINH